MLWSFFKAKAKAVLNGGVARNGDKLNQISNLLDFIEGQNLYPKFPVITSGVNESKCVVDGEEYLMFCSNDYLSLSQNMRVKEAGKLAIDKYGLGPGGSRAVNGNVDIIVQLEKEIASLVGAEDCLTFPTGYMANIAIFQAVMDPFLMGMPYSSDDSVIFSDEYNHGSIVDGCRLSKAKKVVFKHNDFDDLRAKIKANNLSNKLIVTEGVFTPQGELTDLPKFVEVAKETGSKLMIDDAHGVGILGKEGGGSVQYYNCAKDVDIIMGAMDKAFGGIGGYICGNKKLIKYLRITARSSLLSSSYPSPMAGAMLQTIKEIRSSSKEREKLFDNATHLRDGLRKSGFRILGNFDLPAVPLFIGDEETAIKFNDLLWENGIFCTVFRWPAVPMKMARLRITVMLGHSIDDLDKLISVATAAGKKLGII